MTRTLVLGAGGFVGQKIVAHLAAWGQTTPVAAVRRAPGSAMGSSIETVVVDATDAAGMRAALDGVDAVVNCVAGSAAAIREGARILAATAGNRRIVHLSSMAVYGNATGLVAENAPLHSDLGSYGAAKVDAENALASGNTVMLRPGCICGPGSPLWTARIAGLLVAGRLGDLGPAGAGPSNVVDVEDVIRAIAQALALPSPGTFNLALRDSPDWNTYFRALARALDVPCRAIPGWRLLLEVRAMAPLLKLAEMAGASAPPMISPSQMALWRQDIRLEVEAAENALGLKWTPLSKTLERSAAWWRSGLANGVQREAAAQPATRPAA